MAIAGPELCLSFALPSLIILNTAIAFVFIFSTDPDFDALTLNLVFNASLLSLQPL